jgi:iron complex outermembrane receptor protein
MNTNRDNTRLSLAIARILAPGVIAATGFYPGIGALAAASASTDSDLQEIVVTAQRRPESITNVPYNISAVSGATIEDNNVLNVAELMRSIPGVSIVDRGDRNSSIVSGIRIRGLNVDSSALGDYAVSGSATVSTYVNETPIFANFLLTDISRVEVLKGPQGTLYGSGAIGGTVRYILNEPELGTLGGEISASVSKVESSHEEGVSATGVLNLPLGDTMALRIAATHNIYPGSTDYPNVYVQDAHGVPVAPQGILNTAASYRDVPDADFAHQDYGRVALMWKPSDKGQVILSFTGESDRYGGRRGTSLGTNGAGVPYQDNQVGSIQLEPSSRNVYLASLEASLDLGFATLTSSTSQYNHHGDITSESTGFYAQNNWWAQFYYNYPRPDESAIRTYGDKGTIQEFRLVSPVGTRFDYILGFYYQNQSLYSTQDSEMVGFKAWWDTAFPAYASAVINDNDFLYRQTDHFRESALYGQLTYHVSDTVQVTGGYRLFSDRDEVFENQAVGLYSSIFGTESSAGINGVNRGIFKGNASWHFAPTDQVYATVSQGYRRGGSNGVPTTGFFAESPAWLNYAPDTDVDTELGVKGSSGDFTYNADVFYIDWNNPQVSTATTNWGFIATQNAKRATTKGVELQLSGKIMPNWYYGLGYTYTDAKLADDAIAADGTYTINTAGAQLPGSPQHQFNVSTDYHIPLSVGRLSFHADGSYQSSTQDTLFSASIFQNTVPPPNPYAGQPKFYYPMSGFWVWNASAVYGVDKWKAILWVKNIGNVAGVTGVYTDAYMGTSPAQNYFGNGSKALTTLPRTLGLTLNYKF